MQEAQPAVENQKVIPIRKQIPIKQWPCRSIDNYRIIHQVGQGTFGKVYKAEYLLYGQQDDGIPQIVALKKILMDKEKEGFPITALREIMILKRLSHHNILRLIEIVTSRPPERGKSVGIVYLVFEYMEHDMSGLANFKLNFPIPAIKCILYQLLQGVNYLHENNIIHRDIKSANILLNNKGVIKIGDFGLARIINPSVANKRYTNRVVTLIYRAPELLLGEVNYGASIDIWSIGCVFSELLTGVPLFLSHKESSQLEAIFRKCGTPDDTNWPDAKKLPLYNTIDLNNKYVPCLRDYYKDNPKVDDCAFDLLSSMIILDPKMRISIKDALNHSYFTSNIPLMCQEDDIPKIEKDSHEFQAKNILRNKNNQMIGKQGYQHGNQNNSKLNNNSNNNNPFELTKKNSFTLDENGININKQNNNEIYLGKKRNLEFKEDEIMPSQRNKTAKTEIDNNKMIE